MSAERTPEEIAAGLTCEWLRRDRHDGDPLWEAERDGAALTVSVPHAAWFLEWEIDDGENGDARGVVYVEHDAADEDKWDYQGVEIAQARCEAVAAVLRGEAD